MSESQSPQQSSDRLLIAVVAAILLCYGTALLWPATNQLLYGAGHAEHGQKAGHAEPHFLAVIPFMVLLGSIACLPLFSRTEHWWENNLHRFYVAGALALVTLSYYLLQDGPAAIGKTGIANVASTLDHAILKEYIPFIMLLFSLYTICGGIRIAGDLPAHPATNTAFIAAGGLAASFIGTTGAAMLLIRPLLETNSERKHVTHTVIFFIFVVCNCGGCLLPIGDPPLFLGYLRGVDFLWTMKLWPQWLFVNAVLLTVYYLWDRFRAYPKETLRDIALDETRVRRLSFSGLWPNAFLLVGIVLSVALLDPGKTFPGTDWHPPLYLREMVQLGLVGASLLLGSQSVRRANRFNYHAILEVAALFFGIFVCMQPALQILNSRGSGLGIDTPNEFFWITGALSAVLDNAPTYVVFLETAKTLPATPGATMVPLAHGAEIDDMLLVGISLGAVFMGAMTYIGNGPNFMVKAIAEKSGVRMPSFFGYVVYSGCVLLPILALTSWLFF